MACLVTKHLDVIELITEGFFAGAVGFPLDTFPLQQLDKAFRDRIVVAVAASTHAADQVVGLKKLSQSELMNWLPWSEWITTTCLGVQRQTAISRPLMAKSLHIRGFIDQPIT